MLYVYGRHLWQWRPLVVGHANNNNNNKKNKNIYNNNNSNLNQQHQQQQLLLTRKKNRFSSLRSLGPLAFGFGGLQGATEILL